GTVVVLLGYKLSPLWQSQLLTVTFLVTAVTMGIGIVMFESLLSSVAFRRPFETSILKGLAGIAASTALAFLLLRIFDVSRLAAWPAAFAGDLKSVSFWLEMLLGAAAVALLMPKSRRGSPRNLFVGSSAILLNGALYRLNCYLIGYDPGDGWTYFPAIGEILVTLGIFAMHVVLYIIFVKHLPVLHAVRKTVAAE
ncbi:MAG: Ni/Fe-hydrogenase cytochrome b subunit, partial [Rhodospirillales bacterium]